MDAVRAHGGGRQRELQLGVQADGRGARGVHHRPDEGVVGVRSAGEGRLARRRRTIRAPEGEARSGEGEHVVDAGGEVRARRRGREINRREGRVGAVTVHEVERRARGRRSECRARSQLLLRKRRSNLDARDPRAAERLPGDGRAQLCLYRHRCGLTLAGSVAPGADDLVQVDRCHHLADWRLLDGSADDSPRLRLAGARNGNGRYLRVQVHHARNRHGRWGRRNGSHHRHGELIDDGRGRGGAHVEVKRRRGDAEPDSAARVLRRYGRVQNRDQPIRRIDV